MNQPTKLSDIPASIREQIVLVAITALQLEGVVIGRERLRPIEEPDTPTIDVYTGDDTPEPIGQQYTAPRSVTPDVIRYLDLHFEVRAKSTQVTDGTETTVAPDVVLDPLLTWVTYAIFKDPRFGGLALDCFEKQTIPYSREGDRAIASAVRTITVRYRTSRLDPTSKG